MEASLNVFWPPKISTQYCAYVRRVLQRDGMEIYQWQYFGLDNRVWDDLQ